MRLTFYCNFLNHHQVQVADELYRQLADEFVFVATCPRNANELKGGEDYSSRPYCILAGESDEMRAKAMKLARESDVCLFAACSQDYAVEFAKHNIKGIAFEIAERWLKHGLLTIGSSTFRRWLKNYYLYYRKSNFYKLCSSGFAASDDRKLGVYKGRHYKWGYFTSVDSFIANNPLSSSVIHLIWCGRFLKLKHPELPVLMSEKLKSKGYGFILDFYGSGDQEQPTKELVRKLNLEDVVHFHGNRSNREILEAMKNHDVLLFTSNKFEGWGAVVNEAMANKCVVVASDCIGSVPYLIEDGVNGFIFKTMSVDSLTEKVEWILNHPLELKNMQDEAYQLMLDLWSPTHAVESLLLLIDNLQHGRETSVTKGPCSIA